MRLPDHLSARIIVEIGIAFVGVVLFGSALLANQRWLDHHFLPSFYTSRSRYVWIESIVRITIAAIGVVLAFVVRRRLGKFIAYHPARALQITLAILLAFPATEFVLRTRHRRAVMTEERYEIEFQGSRDGVTWIAYPFRYKPQDVRERPGIYAPYQPRFDWNLWFASLAPWRASPWVVLVQERLLEGSKSADPASRRVPIGNLLNRVIGVAATLLLLPQIVEIFGRFQLDPARMTAEFHLAFNVALALIFIGLLDGMAWLLMRILPEQKKPADPAAPLYLDETAIDTPSVALACAVRNDRDAGRRDHPGRYRC